MVDATFTSFCYILPFISCDLPPLLFLLHPSVCGSAVPAGLWSGGVRAQPTIPKAPATAPATDPSNAATLTSSTHRCVYQTDLWLPFPLTFEYHVNSKSTSLKGYFTQKINSPSCRSKPIRNRSSSEHKWRYFWSNQRYVCPFSESRFTQNSSKCF